MAAERRPPQPAAILRGHQAAVHAAAFARRNGRLLTGDADGFVVAWDLTTLRPRAVWQAHAAALLGIASWGDDRIITHGRDHRLVVWQLRPADEAALSSVLPLTPVAEPRPRPWLLHALEVNTLNFCSFASCPAASSSPEEELLLAVPNTLSPEAIDIFHLPSQSRLHTVKPGQGHGMAMALALLDRPDGLTLVAAYEDGAAVVARLLRGRDASWAVTYTARCHSQPVLSLDVLPDQTGFITSGADDVLAKHPIPPSPAAAAVAAAQPRSEPLQVLHTKHAGQQGLRVRSDGLVFATAGWDARMRVYATATMREVAVLKWHQVGCYAAAFARLPARDDDDDDDDDVAAPRDDDGSAVPRLVDVTLRDKRIEQARTAHWLAAGSKDGKVSLWAVF